MVVSAAVRACQGPNMHVSMIIWSSTHVPLLLGDDSVLSHHRVLTAAWLREPRTQVRF